MEHLAQVSVSLLTLAGLVFTAFFAFLGARHSKSANNAVNHTEGVGHRIYKLATDNHTMGTANSEAIERVHVLLEDYMVQEEKRLDKIEQVLAKTLRNKLTE
jgi:hypothetical protein